jgi:hypothetical protein
LATALLSLVSLYFRFGVEQRNKAVGVVADMDTIQELAGAQGISMQYALAGLKQRGLTGVVLNEETVADLISMGQVGLVPSEDGSYYLGGNAAAAERINTGLQVRFPKGARVSLQEPPTDSSVQGKGVSVSGLTAQLIRRTAVGLNPGEAALAKEHGLQIIGRHINPAGGGPSTVRETLQWSHEVGSTIFLPQGDQVLGRRDNLKVMRDTLKELGMYYASPEFAKIGGDMNVVQADPDRVIRLHSAQSQELDKLSPNDAVLRYVRAAEERNQRLLLVRPISYSSAQPLTDFGVFIEKIRDGLKASGHKLQPPHPFEDTRSTLLTILFVLIGLAVAPIIYWVAATFVTSAGPQMLGALLLLVLAIACVTNDGRQVMALLAAVAFPTGAFLMLDARRGSNWMVEFALMSAVSLTGGLCVAALLNGLPYFVRADQFMGVKAAHFIPLGLVGLYFFWRLTPDAKAAVNSPMRWASAALALVVIVGLALMSTRTGNDNPAAVSGLELKLREVLDTILMVRPRTKEFMIGHPLLVVGIALFIAMQASEAIRQKWGGWVTLLLMGGAIGQTSIVNTMCHLHTPLFVSVARIIVGFLAGGIIGAGLWALVRRMQPKEES